MVISGSIIAPVRYQQPPSACFRMRFQRLKGVGERCRVGSQHSGVCNAVARKRVTSDDQGKVFLTVGDRGLA